MEKFEKTAQQIQEQIVRWYLKYFNKTIEDISGKEAFTVFSKLEESIKTEALTKVALHRKEIPVLYFSIDQDTFLICTTGRFLYSARDRLESLDYSAFNGGLGYQSNWFVGADGKKTHVKKEGNIHKFGLHKTNGEVLVWNLPTGLYGYAFWNIAKKFSIIGRKYILKFETE